MVHTSPFAQLDRDSLLKPPKVIAEFVARLVTRTYTGEECRAQTRYLMAVPTIAQPLNGDWQPEGPSFKLVVRDVSVGGVGLLHTRPLKAKFLAIELVDPNRTDLEPMCVVIEVLHCRAVGPMFEIGGRFVTHHPEAAPARMEAPENR
jgi:hypothetical protein